MSRKDDLRAAAESGDLETVRRLIEEEGVLVNAPLTIVYEQVTALHIAVEFGHAEVVQFLLDNKADVNASDCWGDTPLHMACRCRDNNIRVVQLLIGDHKTDINARNNRGRTALHLAICSGADLEVVQYLLDGNADVNISDRSDRTPLHFSKVIVHGITAPVMELFLSHGVDLYAKDEDLETPLHALVTSGSIEAVRVILDHLSSSNDPTSIETAMMCRDRSGCLPFQCVENPEMAKLLLERPLLGEDEDRAVPQVCHAMLFARDGRGRALLDRQNGRGPLFDYLASFTDFPLTVPERRRTLATSSMPCEHRDKRLRHATVPFNPNLNEFQRSTANAFLNKWDQSFQQPGTTIVAHLQDLHAMLPDDVKYVIMAYLTPADIMKI